MFLIIIPVGRILVDYDLFGGNQIFQKRFPIKEVIEFLLFNDKKTDIVECFWDEVTARFTEDEIELFHLETIEIVFHCIIEALDLAVINNTGIRELNFNFRAWSGNDIVLNLIAHTP